MVETQILVCVAGNEEILALVQFFPACRAPGITSASSQKPPAHGVSSQSTKDEPNNGELSLRRALAS